MWLECIGVVSGCCCKEVYRYPHNNYYFPYSTCISSFLAASSLFLYSFKMFFILVILYIIVRIYAQLEVVCSEAFILIEEAPHLTYCCAKSSVYIIYIMGHMLSFKRRSLGVNAAFKHTVRTSVQYAFLSLPLGRPLSTRYIHQFSSAYLAV